VVVLFQTSNNQVEDGPVGIKLTNDARGYAMVLSCSGQAEAKV
jgi:hypothetical protein